MPRLVCILIWSLIGCLPGLDAQDTVYVCDSSRDAVYRMVDVNLDGVIDPVSEVNVFYDDSASGPDLSTPNHLLTYGDYN